jgi:hypothetical protein
MNGTFAGTVNRFREAIETKGRSRTMDIKEQISKVVEEISRNPNIKEQFEKEPVKVIEKLIGVDLPDDIIMKVIDGVKAKLTMDDVSKVAGALKGVFK